MVLRHQTLTLLVTFTAVAFTVLLAFHVPKGFVPTQDTGIIAAVTETAPDTR